MLCWMNGKYVEEDELLISPFDHGFLYGVGFFESFRTYKGKVVFFEEHFHRLCMSLNQYRMYMPYTLVELRKVIEELTNRAGGKDGMFRLNVSAGQQDISLPTKYSHPNVILFRRAIPPRTFRMEKSAQWLKTMRNMPEQESRLKSHHYGNNVLGRFEIGDIEKCEGFFITSKGFVAEGIQSNIFWAKDDILYTPSLATGIVPGITRQWLIVTAKRLGYRVIEGLFFKSELESAYECFTTNAIEGIVPISTIGKVKFLGQDGPIYQYFYQAYLKEVIQTIKRSSK